MRLLKYAALSIFAFVLASTVAFGQTKSQEKNSLTGTAKIYSTESLHSNPYCKGPAGSTLIKKANTLSVTPDVTKGLTSSRSTISVLFLTPDGPWAGPLVTGLGAYPDLTITVFDTANLDIITLADLTPYDVVFAYNDYTWESALGDRTLIGDVLKAYLDAGGKVVENMYLKSYDNWGVAGGYATGNYSAFGVTTLDDWTATSLGTVLIPTHPIMTGVTTLTNNFGSQDPTLAAGADRIADWANGYMFLAAKPNVVSINMLPVDPNSGSPIFAFTGDGLVLFHNAIVWLAGPLADGVDVSPSQLMNPLNTNLLTASDSIKVKVVNNDTAAVTMIPISYVIDGGTVVNDTVRDTIAGSSNVIFTFAAPVDFSTPGHIYDVVIYTHLVADTNYFNDTLHSIVTNYYDAASLTIDEAPVIGPGSISPKATVQNNSNLAATFDVTMEITGGYTSTQTVTSLAPGATTQLTFDPWLASVGSYTIEVYTELAQDVLHTNDTISAGIQVTDLVKAYVYVAYDATSALPQGPAYTYLQSPGTITSLADQSAMQFIGAATWGYGNQWLGAVYGDNTLVSIDTLTGARTVLGAIGYSIAGLAYDYSSDKLYGVEWDGTNSNLYSISVVNGSATLIGTCGTALMINLACDLAGNLYAAAITDDNFYSINKTTGAATLIGPLGFDAAYAQDMEFDLNSGILYMAAYNGVTSGEMRVVNTTTGATTLIGAFAGGAEITGFAIPYITTLPATDAAMVSINGLSSSCGLTATEPVVVTIKNFGTANITSFDVSFVVDGGTAVTEPVTATILPGANYDYTFTGTANLSGIGAHTIVAYVTLTGDAVEWNDTASFTVTQVAVSTVPYTMGFEPTDDLSSWGIFDENGDSYSWYLATTGGNTAPGCMEYAYNSASAANDWLISTCISLETGITYRLGYAYKVQSATYPESMMVHMGTGNTPADQTIMLTDYASLDNITYVTGGVDFTVPANGTYYFGWHCHSAADMWNLFLDDITISDATGVNESENTQNISIFPNPTSGTLNVVSGADVNNITITNMVGAVVYNNEVNGKQFQINTSTFGQGMYFITFKNEAGISTQKFIVE